jgi:hypothetical protein
METSQLSKALYISSSSIHGKGLYTSVDIAARQIIFTIIGETADQDYSEEAAKENPNWIGIGENEWVMPVPDDPSHFLNHSCAPNVMVTDNAQVMAIKPIRANQELVMDYSTTEVDPYWEMPCDCGHSNCRKRIRAFQFLPLNLQLAYLPYVSKRLIKNYLPALLQLQAENK